MLYHEFLTESLLRKFTMDRLHSDAIFDKTVPESGIRNRPDVRIDALKLIIEFDGWQHYARTKTQLADELKDITYRKMGYNIIRIPYFIQLNTVAIEYYFKSYTNNYTEFNTYKCGFIDDRALRPVDFNEYGVARFKNEMSTLPSSLRKEIFMSLDVADLPPSMS